MAAYTTDDGTQTITFDYKQDATSISFNQILRKIMKPGIYEGGLLTRVDNTAVSLSAYTAIVYASNEDTVAIRVETENAYNVSISAAAPYIVLRFEWHNQESNFVEAIAKSEADIASEDPTGDLYVIVGKGSFTGSTLSETFDYTDREAVSKDADTILLGDSYSINSAPIGGTSSVFSGDSTYVTQVLTDIYARLINLSGVGNDAVKQRHVDNATGNTGVHGAFLPIGTDVTYKDGTISSSATIVSALQTLATAYKNATGIDDDVIQKRHIDFGTTETQVNLNDMIAGSTVSQAMNGGVTNYSHTTTTKLSTIITSIAEILNEIATIANGNTTNIATNESDITALEASITTWPIGSIIMFDGVGWVDNSTIPGWWACTAANNATGKTPNLENRFIRGTNTIAPGSGFNERLDGSDSKTLSTADLPSHSHSFSGTSSATTTSEVKGHGHSISGTTPSGLHTLEDGEHNHTWNYNSKRRLGEETFERDSKIRANEIAQKTTSSNGIHSHELPSLNVTGTAASAGAHDHTVSVTISGTTGNTGGGSSIDIRPAFYSLIFIRKCA